MITWVPYDLDQARAAMAKFSTLEQRGLWSCGFMQGAAGAILMGGEPDAFLAGYAAGTSARENSEEYRKEQREAISEKRSAAAKKRWSGRESDAKAMQNPMQTVCKSDAKTCKNEPKSPVQTTNSAENADAKPDANSMQNMPYRTVQDITKQETEQQRQPCENFPRDAREEPRGTRRIWPNRFRYTERPDRNSFIEACKERYPKWQPDAVAAVWDAWNRNGWRVLTGPEKTLQKIGNWAVMAEIWYKNADETEKFEKLDIGSALRAAAPDLSSMRFQA